MSEVRYATNDIGLITLFEQRPFERWCSRHETSGKASEYWYCPECSWEWHARSEAAARERRIAEMAEAFRRSGWKPPVEGR